MINDRLLGIAVLALVAGVGLMVPFEHTLTFVGGVACLFAFIVLGVLAIATPEALGAESRDSGRGDD